MIIHELGTLRPKLTNSEYRCALKNPAVLHCQKTWERVYRAVYMEQESGAVARIEAKEAFCAAMPLLAGDKNIRDFIACVMFGTARGVLMEDTARSYLFAAQVASRIARTQKTKVAKKCTPKSH